MAGGSDIAMTAQQVLASGLPGLTGVLTRARGLLDTASTLSDMRAVQALIDVGIAAARALHGAQSPLETESQFEALRLQMAEALILRHDALCRLAREIDAARERGELAGHGGESRFSSKVTQCYLGDEGNTASKVTGRYLGEDQPLSSPATLSEIGINKMQASRVAQRARHEAAAPGAYAETARELAQSEARLPSDSSVMARIRQRMAVLDAPEATPKRRRRAVSGAVDATEAHRRKLIGAATALRRALEDPRTGFAIKAMSAADLTALTTLPDLITQSARPTIVGGTDLASAPLQEIPS